ncbi:hypothetical protein [Candidatus Lokiarchaeum ossiferum]|uniref:hypothetical protein n=1 Tax=Candidatus Lokiarchaeum ossiferum TaxID=2951803 RepID=UPI00352D57B2
MDSKYIEIKVKNAVLLIIIVTCAFWLGLMSFLLTILKEEAVSLGFLIFIVTIVSLVIFFVLLESFIISQLRTSDNQGKIAVDKIL